ncbi:MAG: hypothetical protein EAZ60_07230 [Oscillatoriales cyanobacterium]|nr:MAG: hypothetical protein EAZ83_07090 [Oscillatoriales cyanobacterium]TAF21862.1 MAG: hypothetical protein EAZ73_07455 [Oscillatoriales cyanobacterium]TAF38222.1 MAG: hypothetical protein EAZ69_04985 [Oscillatoriales cyanobacterium]TAF57365.1 MAG: hypothetical protein EAZ60_07230 [Oscillatoriales cyanobacterium]
MKTVLSHCCLGQGWVLFTISTIAPRIPNQTRKRDRTNSLWDSKTASETLCGAVHKPPLQPQLTRKRSNKLAPKNPVSVPWIEKFQLCLVADSTNSSIFGILETSTQLS